MFNKDIGLVHYYNGLPLKEDVPTHYKTGWITGRLIQQAGITAKNTGLTLADNPYPDTSTEFLIWNFGYECGILIN